MVRDTRKDEQYFNTYIQAHNGYLQDFLTIYEENKDTNPNAANQCISYITGYQENLISAYYSIGLSKGEIKKEVERMIYFSNMEVVDDYQRYIDLLSFIILFSIDPSSAANLLQQTQFDDGITLYLKAIIQKQIPDLSNSLLYKEKPYRGFLNFIQNQSIEEFLEFMNNHYYIQCYEMYWFNNHKSKNDNIYHGYWSYLSAALLSISTKKDISKSCVYIPYDLI